MSGPERYLFPAEGPEEQPVREALTLLTRLCKKTPGTNAILLTHTRHQLQGTSLSGCLGEAVCKSLLAGRSVSLPGGGGLLFATERISHRPRPGDILLVIYADKKLLDKADSETQAGAIIVVPWITSEVADWIATWTPQIGNDLAPARPERLIDNLVVEKALTVLTRSINLGNNLAQSSDRDPTVQLLRMLKLHGETFDPAKLRAWAVRNGWSPRGADRLQEIAQDILDGKRLRVGQEHWRADLIERLRAEVQADEGS